MRILVLGGGISGQLFQHAVPEAEVLDWRSAPRQSDRYLTRHYGVNYLWQPIDGIPCRSFPVVTHIDGRPATSESIALYKAKVGKDYESDTGILLSSQFTPEMTGWEFADFPPARITYGARVTDIDLANHRVVVAGFADPWTYDYLISTIPLYSLMSMCGWRDPGLRYRTIWVHVTARPLDSPYPDSTMYVNYFSNPNVLPYRATDRGTERHYESLTPDLSKQGVPARRIIPGKVYPFAGIEDIHARLGHFSVFCFGRFATWNPEELVHDTWEKITLWKEALHASQR